MHPDPISNTKPRYVPRPGVKPTAFGVGTTLQPAGQGKGHQVSGEVSNVEGKDQKTQERDTDVEESITSQKTINTLKNHQNPEK